MNIILSKMDLDAVEWLASALYDAAEREDRQYVDPDYVETSMQVIYALDAMGRLVDAHYDARVKENK